MWVKSEMIQALLSLKENKKEHWKLPTTYFLRLIESILAHYLSCLILFFITEIVDTIYLLIADSGWSKTNLQTPFSNGPWKNYFCKSPLKRIDQGLANFPVMGQIISIRLCKLHSPCYKYTTLPLWHESSVRQEI